MNRRVTISLFVLYCLALLLLHGMSWLTLRFSYLIPLLLPLALLEKDAKRFLTQWTPFYLIILAYDGLRGFADDLATRIDFMTLPTMERWLCGGILPTLWLQEWLDNPLEGWLGGLLLVSYFGHFFIPVATCYVLWRRDHEAFRLTITSITAISLLGFATFLVFPAAPPWLAAQVDAIPPVKRLIVYHLQSLTAGAGLPRLYVEMNPNPIAPFPSLHAGYPLVLWLCIKEYAPRWQWPFAFNVFLAAFSIVAFGEHYFVDVLGGWVYAILAFYPVRKWVKEKRSRQIRPRRL